MVLHRPVETAGVIGKFEVEGTVEVAGNDWAYRFSFAGLAQRVENLQC
jgi:hypothetical protein